MTVLACSFDLCLLFFRKRSFIRAWQPGLKGVFHQTSEVHYTPPELTTQLQTSENLHLVYCFLAITRKSFISPKRIGVPSWLSHYATVLWSFVTYTDLIKTVQYSAIFCLFFSPRIDFSPRKYTFNACILKATGICTLGSYEMFSVISSARPLTDSSLGASPLSVPSAWEPARRQPQNSLRKFPYSAKPQRKL